MDLEKAFRLSVYGSAALAGMMLSAAEGTLLPTGLTVVVALLAMVLLESGRLRGCPSIVSNFMGLVAFGVAASEFMGGSIESRLLSGAHLLVYLQWIVMLQRKTRRQYWAICALALLQVAVGAVLTEDSWYGMLLVFFLLLQVWTLTVFSLLEAKHRFETSLMDDGVQGLAKLATSTKSASDDSVAGGGATDDRSTRLANLFHTPSFAPDAIQIDPGEPWVNRRLVTTIFGFVFFSLLISSAVFAFTPRLWLPGNISDRNSEEYSEPVRAMTGFSDVVRLGDMGQIIESNDRVMTARLFDNDTGLPLDLYQHAASMGWDEPYFRGSSMHEYAQGRWSRSPRHLGHCVVPVKTEAEDLVRLEIELQNVGTTYLFLMHPMYSIDVESGQLESASAYCWRVGSNVVRPPFSRSNAWPLKYSVYSASPDTADPEFSAWSNVTRWKEWDVVNYFYLGFPESGLERVRQLAKRVAVRESDVEEADLKTKAQRLTAHLSQGTYGYTLDASIEDDSIDPIEDFLFNRKQGHCDYYASALTLMLRAVDVPARLVNGFKGGYQNSIDGGFEVQQRHAHAWCEAFYEGKWHLLDATPSSARSESIVQYDPQFRVLNDVGASLGNLWDRYVVDVSLEGQQQGIYAPLATAFKEWMPVAKDLWFSKLVALTTDRDQWVSWRGGVLTFVLMLFAAMLYRLHPLRRLISLLRRKGLGFGKDNRTEKIVVAFYERFHTLCGSQNLVRSAGQTQQEFATQVTEQLRPRLEATGLLQIPEQVTRFFYDIRFGHRELTKQQITNIDSQITLLETCLRAAVVSE